MFKAITDRLLGKVPLSMPRSPRWRAVRQDYLAKFSACAACGATTKLDVHHIVPYHINQSMELDKGNLITLCDTHHLVLGHLGNYKWWNMDVRTWSVSFSRARKRFVDEKISIEVKK